MTIPPPPEPHAATVDAVVSAANAAAPSRRGPMHKLGTRTTRLQVRGEPPAGKPYGQIGVMCNTLGARVAHRYSRASGRKLAVTTGVSGANSHARGETGQIVKRASRSRPRSALCGSHSTS